MEALQYCRAMEAFCRQRAKMDGEEASFWLTEAELLARRCPSCGDEMQHLADLSPTATLPAVRVYRCLPCKTVAEDLLSSVI